MTRAPRKPIPNPPARLRQRALAGGKWRLWWEPESAIRAMGFAPVDLDAARPTWSVRQAETLNAQVAQARAGAPAPQPVARRRTVAMLVAAFVASPGWAALKPATQADYAGAHRLILRRWGDTPLAEIDKAALVAWYEQLHAQAGAHQAQALLRKFSVLLTDAERRGWIGQNPALRLGLVTPPPRPRLASPAECAALLASAQTPGALPELGGRAATSMAAAIALSLYLGQRETDVIAARAADIGPDEWRLVRSKRGNAGVIAMHPDAWPLIEAARTGAPELLIYEGTGKPYSADLFRRVFARVRDHAAQSLPSVATLQFRDLRRTFASLARDHGASERDVADALGNTAGTDPRLSQTYMPSSASGAARAVAAIPRKDPANA